MSSNPTIQTYDQYAQIYDDEVIEFWSNFPKDFIDRFVSLLPGRRILDLGSGSGRDALLLRDKGLEVVCLDASKTMIEMTTKLGFESHLATFTELNFLKTTFDGVWAYTSLIHVPVDDAREVIRNIHVLLKPSGCFAIGAIEGGAAGMVERKTMPGAARYFKNYSKAELRRLIEPLGFEFKHQQEYQPHKSVYINQVYTLAK